MKDKTLKTEKSLKEFAEMREGQHNHEQPDGEYKDFIELQSILKKVFDTMQIGVTISDVDGRILYVNPADAEMHGYKVEELLGEDVRIFAPTKRWNPMNPEEIKALHKWKRESANLRKDGSIFAAQLMSDVITDTGGKVIGIITTCEDITARKDMEEKLKESEEKFRSLVDSTDDSIFLLDSNYKFLFMNKKHLFRMGISEGEYTGRSFIEFHPPEEAGEFIAKVDEVFRTGESIHNEYKGQKNNQYFLQTLSPIKDQYGMPEAVTVISKDITEHKKTEEQVRFLAYFDSLTGLPNRFFFKELLDKALSHAERHKLILATLFLDVDNFKRINDTLGHDIGDELLQAVTARLLKSVRNSDSISRANDNTITNTLSRLGGDEFVVLLSEIADVPDAAVVARRLLKDISEPYMLKGHKVIITASVGISVYPSDGEDAQSLLKYADLAMYHAKDIGKNNYQYYTESMKSAAFERLTLEGELNKALEKDEFSVYYQAKLDVQSRKIIGMEALIRWKHPEKALVSPSGFIPLAEETGQIIAIDEWVLHTACLQNKAWQDAGFAPMVIAVNLSTSHLENRKLTKVVAKALQDSGLEPQCLELEITESKIMKNPVISIIVLNELKAMGVRIAIDDFGTGHSSLNYLRQIPLDYVKIDRSFVMNITTSPHDTAIIKSIITLAHSLDLKVIAEGVETEQQLEFLREHECDEVQGYLFSKPVTADIFTQLLKEGKTL
jgi:diguanylate cyclase (GGDEF)-like protein/PAS domain S-box-containing protein